jgi:hypothetical protein
VVRIADSGGYLPRSYNRATFHEAAHSVVKQGRVGVGAKPTAPAPRRKPDSDGMSVMAADSRVRSAAARVAQALKLSVNLCAVNGANLLDMRNGIHHVFASVSSLYPGGVDTLPTDAASYVKGLLRVVLGLEKKIGFYLSLLDSNRQF